MRIPVQISYRHMEPPPGADEKIHDRVEALDRFFPRIMACRVVVERTHHRHHKGNLFHLRIDLTVPGRELAVTRDPPAHKGHEDLESAIRDAFDEVRRQLEDHARQVRADVKAHATPPHGRIARLFPYEGYGFIAAADGQEVYFQRASVCEASFDDLAVGDEVRYFAHPGEGEKGEQASMVTPVGKHHLPPAGMA